MKALFADRVRRLSRTILKGAVSENPTDEEISELWDSPGQSDPALLEELKGLNLQEEKGKKRFTEIISK